MRFLAQPEGENSYLNVMCRWRGNRFQLPECNRYFDDAVLDRRVAEFASTLSRPWFDRMPFKITPAIDAVDVAHYRLVAKRVTYFDNPALPKVSDNDFAEFARRFPKEHEPKTMQRRFLEFCEALNAR